MPIRGLDLGPRQLGSATTHPWRAGQIPSFHLPHFCRQSPACPADTGSGQSQDPDLPLSILAACSEVQPSGAAHAAAGMTPIKQILIF